MRTCSYPLPHPCAAHTTLGRSAALPWRACSAHSLSSTVCSLSSTVYSLSSIVHSLSFTVCSLSSTVCSLSSTVRSLSSTVHASGRGVQRAALLSMGHVYVHVLDVYVLSMGQGLLAGTVPLIPWLSQGGRRGLEASWRRGWLAAGSTIMR